MNRDRARELFFLLVIACEGHQPSVCYVLGLSQGAVAHRLRTKHFVTRWRAYKAARSLPEQRATHQRWWWRERIRGIGIDPHTLSVTDPVWTSCHRLPRGAYVRAVADEMRVLYPGESLATDERLEELLRRVDEKMALGPSSVIHP